MPGGAPVTPIDKLGNVIGSTDAPSQAQLAGANTTTVEGWADANRLRVSGGGDRPLVVLLNGWSRGTSTTVALTADTNGLFTQQGTLPAGTDRSGSAITSSGQLAAANAARRGLEIQNIGANNIGVNEFGGAAAIGTAGTYTLTPGSSMRVRTNRQVNVIAATGTTAFTATEF